MEKKEEKITNPYIEALEKGEIEPDMSYSQYSEKFGVHLEESEDEVIKKVKILEEYPRG